MERRKARARYNRTGQALNDIPSGRPWSRLGAGGQARSRSEVRRILQRGPQGENSWLKGIICVADLTFFSSATRRWFENAFAAPTPVQLQGWERIAAGDHALLIAPTGSGKTLAAFLYALDRLGNQPVQGAGVRVVYVSPLKALVYDIERNLRTPLAGIARSAAALEQPFTPPRIDIRTGDTTQDARRRFARDPGDILVTTPESLFLILGAAARETLRSVEFIIVDEIHAMAATKRGAHLALSLERLSALADRDPQRIGLSATARPAEEVARFLGGDRAVQVIDTHKPPAIDLQVIVPVEDMTRPVVETEDGGFVTVPDNQGQSGSLMLADETETTRQFGIWLEEDTAMTVAAPQVATLALGPEAA